MNWSISWSSGQYVTLVTTWRGFLFFSPSPLNPQWMHQFLSRCGLLPPGLPGRGCQGGEQRGGGDSHEPPRKNHLGAHRQPSRQLPANGTCGLHLWQCQLP